MVSTGVSKTWKFVLNNWEKKDREFFENLDVNQIVFGEEVGESGTPHLQGHIVFKRCYRLKALKKIHEKCHWEIAKCADFNYELKGTNVFIKDNRRQGKRTDLEEIAQMIKDGKSVTEVAKAYPSDFIRYHRGIRELKKELTDTIEKSSFENLECCNFIRLERLCLHLSEVLYGRPGCGKTQFALSHFESPLFVNHIDDLKNFKPSIHDGIVFDDMDFKHMPRTAQIHLVDNDNTRSIHCRYETVTIPKHTKKIFVANSYPFIDDSAISRRVNVTEVRER